MDLCKCDKTNFQQEILQVLSKGLFWANNEVPIVSEGWLTPFIGQVQGFRIQAKITLDGYYLAVGMIEKLSSSLELIIRW